MLGLIGIMLTGSKPFFPKRVFLTFQMGISWWWTWIFAMAPSKWIWVSRELALCDKTLPLNNIGWQSTSAFTYPRWNFFRFGNVSLSHTCSIP